MHVFDISVKSNISYFVYIEKLQIIHSIPNNTCMADKFPREKLIFGWAFKSIDMYI